ncbi:MAG: DUF401 family protein [Candidatus Latescibacteria bacterium]|nr:DUF401 family protein [Candidatus Latescibacterota bacterium]
MIEALKVLLAFSLIIVLLRIKWPLGTSMLVGAAVLALLYGQGPSGLAEIGRLTLSDRLTIELIVILTLITAFSAVLRESGTLDRLTSSLKQLAHSTRLVAAGLPALIGLLPMPGGALFSAPMVDSAFEGIPLSAERKSFINHWFRHIWEYCWPLYPGVILTVELTGYELGRFILYQLPLTAVAIIAGTWASLRHIPAPVTAHQAETHDHPIRQGFVSFLPILVVIVLSIGLGLHLIIAFLIGIALSLWMGRNHFEHPIRSVLLKSLSLNTVVLIVGIMAFKQTLESTGVIGSMADTFARYGIPPFPLFIIIPFLVGLVSGLTIAPVGVAFPIIFPLIDLTGNGIGYVVLAYASGFAGVILSPVHLCLILTREYFHAEMGGIYRLLWLPTAALIVAGAAICLWMMR